jgi:hypothetical protein
MSTLARKVMETLSYLLRHKELWPTDFAWDYSKCENCAIGLAVFQHVTTGVERSSITPEMVADAIDNMMRTYNV